MEVTECIRTPEAVDEVVLLDDLEVLVREEGSIMGDKLCILTPLRKCNTIKIFH